MLYNSQPCSVTGEKQGWVGKQGKREKNQDYIKVGRKREGDGENASLLMEDLVNSIREKRQTVDDEKHQSMSKK